MPNSPNLPPAEQLILQVCAVPDKPIRSEGLDWSPEDFDALIEKSLETRTAPLLSHAIDFSGGAAQKRSEDAMRNAQNILAKITQTQTFLFLTQCRSLAKASLTLREAGLKNVVLKGFPLAFNHYPKPGLRPLRDLDLLFAPSDALKAQEILLANGFERFPGSGVYGLEYGHQLPEIIDSELGILFEVHHRLNARDWAGDPRLTAKVIAEATHLEVLGETVEVSSVHANFLHLIEHATVHHLFGNGPLILSDLHWLASSGEIDWNRLLSEVHELGLDRSLQLMTAIALRNGAQWVPECLLHDFPEANALAREAEQMLLLDSEEVKNRQMIRRIQENDQRSIGLLSAIKQAFKPNPYQLGKIADCPPDAARRWLAYPTWLLARGKRYFTSRKSPHNSNIALSNWLKN